MVTVIIDRDITKRVRDMWKRIEDNNQEFKRLSETIEKKIEKWETKETSKNGKI